MRKNYTNFLPQVHSESENLLIPIHAYPVMNDVLFPVRLDFGKCATDHLCVP
jgi:hypothetical protein